MRRLSTAEIDCLPVFAALRQLFNSGAWLKYAPGFGIAPLTGALFTRAVDFVRVCRSGEWLARVGLG